MKNFLLQPQLPRKIVKQVSSAPQTKMRLKFEAPQKNEGSSKEVSVELYDALLVDRDNKDATIRDNELHIDELYERIRDLEKELGQLQLQKDELTETHKIYFQRTDNGTFIKTELQSNEMTDLKQQLEKRTSDLLDIQEKCTVLENTVAETRNLLRTAEQEKHDLLLKVNQLKENEEELRCRYETDIKELDAVCKKLVDEMAGMKANEDENSLEKEVKMLKEELSSLRNTNTDLDSKLSQKQQMILLLQGELSSAELELEECKSENEKMTAEFKVEKNTMTEKYGSDMEEMRNLIKKLEGLLSEEREMRMQEMQILEENVLNSSVVRENLETIIADKQAAFSALNDKYLALEAEFEKSCMEQKLVTEAHRLEMDEICNKHEEEMCKWRVKEKEAKLKMEDLVDKYRTLQSEFEKCCMEHKHMTASYWLKVDEIKCKHEEELDDMRAKLTDKETEIEKRINEIMEACAELEERVKDATDAAEENLIGVKNAAEERIKEFEVEAAGRISDCETRMEVKLKEAEHEIHAYKEQTTQVEEELRRMTHHRDELRISNMENQLTIVDLQDKIDTLVTELNSAKESYETNLTQAQNECTMSKKQCKKLEIGISNIQASLEALQMRLLESECYGEQLTNAVQQAESQKAALEEQVKILTQELEASKQSMIHLERDTVQQIEDTRKDLLCKLEDFKVKADKNIAAKEEEILEHRHKIEELSARIFELTENLSAVEETNTEHEHEIEALTEKLDHQRDCAKIATQQIATLEASNAIYQHQVQALTTELEYHKDFSQKASDHIATLNTAKANLEIALCDLISEVKVERQEAFKFNGESEETTAIMNCNSETGSDHLSVLKENLDQYKEEMKSVIKKLESDIKTREFDIEQKNIDICRKKCEIKKATERITQLISENTKLKEKSTGYSNKTEELFSEIKELKASFQEKLDSELKRKLAEKEAYCQR
jgi:chromosome segregation ATPase